MTPHRYLATALVLGSSLAAQHVSSPPGYLNKEGNTNTTFSLGDYRDGHFQYADGFHRGKAMTIKGTAYRLSNYIYGTSTGSGRSWTNVQLCMSETDLATFDRTFTNNNKTTPTEVFSAPVTWADQTGKPPQFPADWTMSFPFATNWNYSGNSDLCFEYKFSGGTLANNSTWTSSASPRYYKDCQDYPTSIRVTSTNLGDSGANAGCNDRGVNHVNGAHITSNVTTYGSDYSTASLRETMTFTQSGSWFAENRPATVAIGFRSITKGFALAGVTCNNVYIDFSLPTFLIPAFSNSNGSLTSINLNASNVGVKDLEIVTQVLWRDSKTLDVLLSDAATVTIPESPHPQPTNLLYHHLPSSTTGSLSANRSFQPVRRITK